ncbi:hypothetical protein [Streptomyces sp. NPDC016675]|uniref:hypothetical protein n=1 Tax=Streptomyces sp. NPDC016675 TaxID=3364970 RepID=UPI0036FEBF1B
MTVLGSGLVVHRLTRGRGGLLRTYASSSNSGYSAGYCSAESADHASYASDERGYTLIHMEGIARTDEERLGQVDGVGHASHLAQDRQGGVCELNSDVCMSADHRR